MNNLDVRFDKPYPVEEGIVNCLPPHMQDIIEPDLHAEHFFTVHHTQDIPPKFATDKYLMACVQREFYDRMSVAFEGMDEADRKSGGVFHWKIMRCFRYDNKLLGKPGRLLFIGAGNCRLARLFALRGWDVTATDISRQMLIIGQKVALQHRVNMTYVAHNAEDRFPFESNQFDAVYSLCVMNHIVDWKNYVSEKLRCLKPGGVLVERLPNIELWKFWKQQGPLYYGIEARALACTVDTITSAFDIPEITNLHVWTHDKQQTMLIPRVRYLTISHLWYKLRTYMEDIRPLPKHRKGIYTMVTGVKK